MLGVIGIQSVKANNSLTNGEAAAESKGFGKA